jgi:alginate production protein
MILAGARSTGLAMGCLLVALGNLTAGATDIRWNDLEYPFHLSGKLSSETEIERNYRLNDPDTGDEMDMHNIAEVEVSKTVSDLTRLFAKTSIDVQLERDERDQSSDQNALLQLDELWFETGRSDLNRTRLRAGQQRFRDDRQWWWDEELPALRTFHDREGWYGWLALSGGKRPLKVRRGTTDPTQSGILQVLGNATYTGLERDTVSLYLLARRDDSGSPVEGEVVPRVSRDESDADLLWLGARATGRLKTLPVGRLYYWLDTAFLRGDERLVDYDRVDSDTSLVDSVNALDVKGYALDLGITVRTNGIRQPRFTLGYARGSGDADPDDNTDHRFRQTGLHDNDTRFQGESRIKRYGELLEPDLGNLEIFTGGLGFNLTGNAQLDVMAHWYRQVELSVDPPRSNLRGQLSGASRDVGNEVDLVLWWQHTERLQSELILGYFQPGLAFVSPTRSESWFLGYELEYRF